MDMGVDHGRGQIAVSEQLLNGADVGAALKQVGGEGSLSVNGVVVQAEYLSDLIEEFWLDFLSSQA